MRVILGCISKNMKIIFQIIGLAALFGVVIGMLFGMMFFL